MIVKYKLTISFLIFALSSLIFQSDSLPQTNKKISPSSALDKLTLVHATMCEGIRELSPKNTAIIFSIGIGEVSCFTSFDPVPKEINIYQKWFHKDKLSTKKRLLLKPPRWSTYSTIQLREADKGPWRVEITDNKGNRLKILRFSIVD